MLRVQTRNLGNVTVLCLQGRIVNGEKASLRQAMDSQLRTSVVVLDLGRVTAIDASGPAWNEAHGGARVASQSTDGEGRR